MLAHIVDRLTLSANSTVRLRALPISENIMSYASYPSYTSYPKVIFFAKLHRAPALPFSVQSHAAISLAISLAIFSAKLNDGKGYKCKYDKPKTPYQRLLDDNVLTPEQRDSLKAYKAKLNGKDIFLPSRPVRLCGRVLTLTM